MNPSHPYTKQEWDLVTKVMDTVDELRSSSSTPVDRDRVKSLVMRTYQSQGNAADEALVDQALDMALDAFPVAPPGRAAIASVWWEVPAQNGERDEETPMDQAQRAVLTLCNHSLKTQAQLHQLVESAQIEVENEYHRAVSATQLRIALTMSAALVGLVAGIVLVRALFPLGILLVWLSLMGLIIPRINAKHFIKWHLQSPRKEAAEAFSALRKMSNENYPLKLLLGKTIGHGTTYDPAVLTEGSGDEWEWKSAHDVARQDPLLAKVWRQWLESSLPIRKGDTDLLRNTAEKIRNAKAWMALYDAPLSLQHGMRQQLLKTLDS